MGLKMKYRMVQVKVVVVQFMVKGIVSAASFRIINANDTSANRISV